jgi:hypothetical protein
MIQLTELLKNHKDTPGYDLSIHLDGYNVPEIGETVYTDKESMLCTDVIIYSNGFVIIVLGNGRRMAGTLVSEMVAAGKLKIK